MNESEIQDQLGISKQVSLLPAWFTMRMMSDHWHFGLLTITGQIIEISEIRSIVQASDGTIWLDVFLSEFTNPDSKTSFVPPCPRLEASINASHVIAAFEMCDS